MLAGIILVSVLVAMFIGSYVMNKRTEAPECEINFSECEGCKIASCPNRKN